MSKYRIRAVSKMTGLSTALIRAWEARYGLVSPERTPAGYRLYSDEEVALLQGAQRLVQQGISPMEIARMPRYQLREESSTQLSHFTTPKIEAQSPLAFAELHDRIIEAIANFDNERAEELLSMPLLLLSPHSACHKFLAPLLREIGERWHRGELTIAAEHFGTNLVRNKLKALLETMRMRRKVHRVLCACPPGEQHEAGLLMFAIEAISQGWDPIYLGANVPLADFAASIRTTQPELAAVSLIVRREPKELFLLLSDLQAATDGICPLLVGGRALFGQDELVHSAGCVTMPRSGQLADLLPLQ